MTMVTWKIQYHLKVCCLIRETFEEFSVRSTSQNLTIWRSSRETSFESAFIFIER